jgi:hypothetical protein
MAPGMPLAVTGFPLQALAKPEFVSMVILGTANNLVIPDI